MSSKGKLYLIPIPIAEDQPVDKHIPKEVFDAVQEVQVFFVENIKTARRYLRKIDRTYPIDDKVFYILNKRSKLDEVLPLVKKHLGSTFGMISEAGCPGIADPGELLVHASHQLGVRVVPLVGPSSILLALIASGKNGQQFTFNGYIAKDRKDRVKEIKRFEQLSRNGVTQIFMETPFRNNHLLEDLLIELENSMLLCIACDINGQKEFIKTKSVADWKINPPNINKRPTIFIL